MSGFQLAEFIHTERPEVPILFMSGYSPEDTHCHIELVEGENFIPKPFTPSKFAQRVRTRLDRARALPH